MKKSYPTWFLRPSVAKHTMQIRPKGSWKPQNLLVLRFYEGITDPKTLKNCPIAPFPTFCTKKIDHLEKSQESEAEQIFREAYEAEAEMTEHQSVPNVLRFKWITWYWVSMGIQLLFKFDMWAITTPSQWGYSGYPLKVAAGFEDWPISWPRLSWFVQAERAALMGKQLEAAATTSGNRSYTSTCKWKLAQRYTKENVQRVPHIAHHIHFR